MFRLFDPLQRRADSEEVNSSSATIFEKKSDCYETNTGVARDEVQSLYGGAPASQG